MCWWHGWCSCHCSQAAASDGSIPGQIIFGQSFTLKNGQTMTGDLMIFGGSATIEKGASVNGNVVVFGGSLTIHGSVTHDAVIFGGTATLGSTAHIHGNLSALGSTLDRAEGALVDGQVNNGNIHFGNGQNGYLPSAPLRYQLQSICHFQPFCSQPIYQWRCERVGQSVALALLAMLLMLFLAQRADRVAHAIIAQPLTAGGLGLLTLVAVPVILAGAGPAEYSHYHPDNNRATHGCGCDGTWHGAPVRLDCRGV